MYVYCFIHIIGAGGSPRICNIISTSLPTLTTPNGVIANGTEDVILYCTCMQSGVAVGPTEWSFNSALVTTTQANGTNPYYRDNVPSPLIIPLFVTGNDGTYRCGSDINIGATSDNIITLTLPGTYVYGYFCKLRTYMRAIVWRVNFRWLLFSDISIYPCLKINSHNQCGVIP